MMRQPGLAIREASVPISRVDLPPKGAQIHPWYGLAALAYMAGLTWLSSVPRLDAAQGDPLVEDALNLGHIPLFAGLTFLILKAVSGGRGQWQAFGKARYLSLLGVVLFAALNEALQIAVPGRIAAFSDLLLDIVGIGLMFVMLQLTALFPENL